jgi:hypothetical protein
MVSALVDNAVLVVEHQLGIPGHNASQQLPELGRCDRQQFDPNAVATSSNACEAPTCGVGPG